jgi:hypothetical protein
MLLPFPLEVLYLDLIWSGNVSKLMTLYIASLSQYQLHTSNLKKKKPVKGQTFIAKQSKRKITENYMGECFKSRCSYTNSFLNR